MKRLFGAAFAVLALACLSGCTGSAGSDIFKSLANDPASACVQVDTSVAGYAGHIVVGRSNSTDGSAVTVDKNGVCTITRSGASSAGAPLAAAK